MYSWQIMRPKLIPKVYKYISKVIWINIIPKGTKKNILCLCPGSNRGSQRCNCKNIKKLHNGFELWSPALELRSLPLDHQSQILIICTKLYLQRSQVKEQTLVVLNGTNIFLVGLYFYFFELHMWNLELRYGQFLLESCNPNLNQTGPFSGYIFPTVNSKNLQ